MLVEAELTLGVVEALRRAELAAQPNAPDVYVRDADGQFYRLALRDVGPSRVVAALNGLTLPEY